MDDVDLVPITVNDKNSYLINFQIGFNAGNATRSYEYKPYSQASVLRDLTGRGWANGFPGRHIFRIDENILMGTCNKDIGEHITAIL